MTCSNRDQAWHWNDLDHPSAAKLLANHFPDSNLEPFGSGDFCLAFKRGGQVIRLARHAEAARALERESCILPKIAPLLPLPVPQPTYHALHGCPPFAVHEEIVGEALTREDWETMLAVDRERVALNLATFLKAFHSLPIQIGLECGLIQIETAALAYALQEKVVDTIHGLLEPEVQRKLDQTLKRWSSQREVPNPVLIHRDIGPGHLLYDPLTLQLMGVIDFGDLAIGDPARDFIYVYEDFGPMILNEVLKRYAGKDASKMMSAIRKWYLLEALSWTIEKYRKQHQVDLDHGLAEIRRELAAVEMQFSNE